MQARTHIINRQVFEFDCLHQEHAFQIKNKFDKDVQYKISAVINNACDQLDIEDADLRIPLLEINLGNISFEKLEQEIVYAFEKKFYDLLTLHKNQLQDEKNSLLKQRNFSLEVLKFFMLTGHLPWFAGKQDEDFLEDLFEEVFTSQSEAIRKFIFLNIENEKFIGRLIGQAASSQVNHIIRMLGFDTGTFASVQKAISKVIEEMFLLLKNAGDKNIREHYQISTKQIDNKKQQEVIRLLTRYIQGDQNNIFTEIKKLTLSFIIGSVTDKKPVSLAEKFSELFEKIFREKFEFSNAAVGYIILKEQKYFYDLPASLDKARIEFEPLRLKVRDEQTETDDFEAGLKFYISNAGLVLIANYFPVFFKQMNLLSESGSFLTMDSKVKAVFLLHYLCMGKEQAPEYILPLNKLLCGLALDEPLPSFVLLNGNEKRECEELLTETISNWQKIGNSSIESFREAFLNREAVLTYDDNRWKLQVERKGYDVLLDALPWSFTHIKLSWMQDVIITEW